jgi:S-adenosylmethionine:tRNA ribosyltransferase-isomerase
MVRLELIQCCLQWRCQTIHVQEVPVGIGGQREAIRYAQTLLASECPDQLPERGILAANLGKAVAAELIKGEYQSHGAWGRNRTDTPLPEPDFESGASTNFATQARGEGRRRLAQGAERVNRPLRCVRSRPSLDCASFVALVGKAMVLSLRDFHFDLPDAQIAQTPPAERGQSRLLVLDPVADSRHHCQFQDLPDWLQAGDLLILNDTRVVPARIRARKDSGGAVELLLERLEGAHQGLFQARASKAPKAGRYLRILDCTGEVVADAEVLGREADLFRLRVEGQPLMDLLQAHGEVPLPPYIRRQPGQNDVDRYQTVYAQHDGAVAAPTAGLHFDQAMLDRLAAAGIERAYLTLHVGAGTFAPVRVDDVSSHRMHAERFAVPEATIAAIAACRARGGRVVAIGTTVVRVLETLGQAADDNGAGLQPQSGETDIFIYPGFRFRVVDALLTNFHLPESTLLMLVSAFAGRERVLAAYQAAVDAGYRFFSYGDAMFITRRQESDDGR